MGLTIRNPLVASASPLWKNADQVKRVEDAGAAAVVLHSLFEEQIIAEERELNRFLLQGTEHFAEALTYFPEQDTFQFAPEMYLNHLQNLKDSVSIPIIASLNGVSTGAWVECAEQIEQAGADALELNIYYIPATVSMGCHMIERNHVELIREVRKRISIPLAVKISPYFSSLPAVAQAMSIAGADALVIFNRFYQPDFDLETLEVMPNLQLSTSAELRLRLRWLAILSGSVDTDMAVTGGVHSMEDAIKAIMAGASVFMMTSAILKHGIRHVEDLLAGFNEWMNTHDYAAVADLRGVMSQGHVAEPAAFERANYMKTLASFIPETHRQLSVGNR
jgi:dihydroorotate dehydrogenase (fumarate)